MQNAFCGSINGDGKYDRWSALTLSLSYLEGLLLSVFRYSGKGEKAIIRPPAVQDSHGRF
ncbi:MAG: hypothetical protein DRP59_12770 [Spirochaetes bacterium]|nr:MAG: hypothetical protein DRP59_12770 [Spirochaetota bacterium]